MLLFSTGLDLMCAYNQFCFNGDLTVFERNIKKIPNCRRRSGRSVEAKRKLRGEFPRINLWGYGSREKTVKD